MDLFLMVLVVNTSTCFVPGSSTGSSSRLKVVILAGRYRYMRWFLAVADLAWWMESPHQSVI